LYKQTEQHPEFAAELPVFVTEIRRLFTAEDIREYLDHLEKTKYLAPPEPDLDLDDADEEIEEEPWLENPAMGAEELLRFFRLSTAAAVAPPSLYVMAKPKRDPVREDRIHHEAIVDAYGPDEQASWYYYLEERIISLS